MGASMPGWSPTRKWKLAMTAAGGAAASAISAGLGEPGEAKKMTPETARFIAENNIENWTGGEYDR